MSFGLAFVRMRFRHPWQLFDASDLPLRILFFKCLWLFVFVLDLLGILGDFPILIFVLPFSGKGETVFLANNTALGASGMF